MQLNFVYLNLERNANYFIKKIGDLKNYNDFENASNLYSGNDESIIETIKESYERVNDICHISYVPKFQLSIYDFITQELLDGTESDVSVRYAILGTRQLLKKSSSS